MISMIKFTVKERNLAKAYPDSGGWWIARWNGQICDALGWLGPGMAYMDATFTNVPSSGRLDLYAAPDSDTPVLSADIDNIRDQGIVTADFATRRVTVNGKAGWLALGAIGLLIFAGKRIGKQIKR